MLCFTLSIPFFFTTLEEYYTGELTLPIVNGATEGTLIGCFAMNAVGFLGRDNLFVKINLFSYSFPLKTVIVFTLLILSIVFPIISLFSIIKNYKSKTKRNPLYNLSMYILMISAMIILIIFSKEESIILKNHPKIICILYGFGFAKLTSLLQFAHVCDSPFFQFQKTLLICFLSLIAVPLIKCYLNFQIIHIDYLIITCLVLNIVVWIHYAYFLTEELCEVLGIYRFSVEKRKIFKLN